MELRDYQKECISEIEKRDSGAYLIQMATGLGKTATFTHIPRKGKVLVLAHREELVTQPAKYYNCPVGIEMANKSSNGEPVVIASVQSIVNRLEKFSPYEFDMLITDECHHAAANTYKKIYNYFRPRLHLGFTATPNRNDDVRLDDVYEEIIFQRDLKWAIKNGYLTDIHCLRVNIGYNISGIARRMGDYAPGELEKAMNQNALNDAIAEAYKEYAKGQTLIFACSVDHAKAIAEKIPGAVAVTADTNNRAEIIKRFTNREIPVIVNCMIFTEGTDMPLVETVMIARPTSNSTLYTQMVGRGLRLYPGKEKLTLIDLVGTTGRADLCTAPTLIGMDMKSVPERKQDEIQGDLFELPGIIERESDCIESWIKNVEIVDLWAKKQNYNTHKMNLFQLPDGSFTLQIPKLKFKIGAPNELGQVQFMGEKMKMQDALDMLYEMLTEDYTDSQYIWDLNKTKYWRDSELTDKQASLIHRLKPNLYINNLSRFEASQVINRLTSKCG